MINRGGATLTVRIADQTGASSASIAAAFAAARQSYDLVGLNAEIDALDNKIPGDLQLSLYAQVQDLLLDRLVWFLRQVDLRRGLENIVAHYRAGIARVESTFDTVLSKAALSARDARTAELTRAGVPGRTRAKPRQPAGAEGGDRYRAGGGQHAGGGRRRGCHLFRGGGLLPTRPRRCCCGQHRGGGLFRPPRARPRARFDRRRRAAAHRGHGRQRQMRAPERWRHGSRRARRKSSASARRFTRSPAPG